MILKKWFIFSLIAVGLISCIQQEQKPEFVPNPATLTELFRGFNKEELTPEVSESNKEPVVIVATGHLYPLLNYPLAYNALINEVKKQKPDYFFTLGDIVYNNTNKEWDTVFKHLNSIGTKIFFAPGNHDLNFHYERYFGKRDNQIEAEMRYLDHVGYRYKLFQDQFANYVFINANDSVYRILSFLEAIKHKLDYDKQLFLLSSQSLWHNKHQLADDPHTWVNRPFRSEELLPFVEDFNYLIHGDWGKRFYRGNWNKSEGKFDVLAVGNRKVGDSLFITRLEVYKDSLYAVPVMIDIPDSCGWYKKE